MGLPLPLAILFLPLVHFVLFVFLPGLILSLILARLRSRKRLGAFDFLWSSVSLGILWNTSQFVMALLLLNRYWVFQPVPAFIKYGMDLFLLLGGALCLRQEVWCVLRAMGRHCLARTFRPVLALALLMGVLATLHFPHSFDSGQLIQTNHLLLTGDTIYSGFRIGMGFSALLYFPGFNPWGLPIATLSGGYKLVLWLLGGLLLVTLLVRLAWRRRGTLAFLGFLALTLGIFGLYGMGELGKDSSWGVLLSLVAMVLAVQRRDPFLSGALFLASFAMGVIAIPFSIAFLGVWLLHAVLPVKGWWGAGLYGLLLLLSLWASLLLMPVGLPQYGEALFRSVQSRVVFFPPADGETGFLSYYLNWAVHGVRNVPLLITAGLGAAVARLFLPRLFSGSAWRALGLFMPLTTLFLLLLTLPAQGWQPASRLERIPGLPLSPFDLWNLIKDMAQWYLQPVSLLLLLGLAPVGRGLERFWRRRWEGAFLLGLLGLVLAGAWGNRMTLQTWLRPAHFDSHSAHADPLVAATIDFLLHRDRWRCRLFVEDRLPIRKARFLAWDLSHYAAGVQARFLPGKEVAGALRQEGDRGAVLLVTRASRYPQLAAVRSGALEVVFEDAQRDLGVYYVGQPAS